eukprot:TRINITY_DN1769_c0_g1_i3.p1 TRINITY_DN1769_c0_g1~~TRINITY_DN1769_c0_g1_i3.p1  ORF type:complete len:609 (-),score=148.51 TRINITY_DN1769_c0_g1_i3:272-2098(-)
MNSEEYTVYKKARIDDFQSSSKKKRSQPQNQKKGDLQPASSTSNTSSGKAQNQLRVTLDTLIWEFSHIPKEEILDVYNNVSKNAEDARKMILQIYGSDPNENIFANNNDFEPAPPTSKETINRIASPGPMPGLIKEESKNSDINTNTTSDTNTEIDVNFDIPLEDFQSIYIECTDALRHEDIDDPEEFARMIKICEDKIKWWIDVRAGFEEDLKSEELDLNHLQDQKDLVVAIQAYIQHNIQAENKQKENWKFTNNDFPTLGGGARSSANGSAKKPTMTSPSTTKMAPNPSKNPASINQIEYLEEEAKRAKQAKLNAPLFTGTDGPQIYEHKPHEEWSYNTGVGLYETDKKTSSVELRKLADLFPNLDVVRIRLTYRMLEENFEQTKQFLINRHPEQYVDPLVNPRKQVVRRPPMADRFEERVYSSYEDENFDRELLNLGFEELRRYVNKHNRLYNIFAQAQKAASSVQNHYEMNKFKQMASHHGEQMRQYKLASRHLFLQKLRRNNAAVDRMDLHGFYWEEAKDLVKSQLNYLRNLINRGRIDQTRCAIKVRDNQRCLMMEIITGKGNNSVNNNPKLHPKLKDWLSCQEYTFQAKQDEGRIFVYLPI